MDDAYSLVHAFCTEQVQMRHLSNRDYVFFEPYKRLIKGQLQNIPFYSTPDPGVGARCRLPLPVFPSHWPCVLSNLHVPPAMENTNNRKLDASTEIFHSYRLDCTVRLLSSFPVKSEHFG